MPLHTTTLFARSPSGLLRLLFRLPNFYADNTLLFALSASPTIPHEDLSILVKTLSTLSRQALGCLSAPLPGRNSNLVSCSLAVFDPSKSVPFRSTTPGRAVPQVGRWHAFRNKDSDRDRRVQSSNSGLDDAFHNWGEVLDGSASRDALPVELEHIKSVFIHLVSII